MNKEQLPTSSNNIVKMQEKLNFSSTHAQSMVLEGSIDAREANKWADALCMDPQIVESIVGKEIADICKDEMSLSKPFISNEEIKRLPEFKKYLADYMIEKNRIYQSNLEQQKEHNKKELLLSIEVPLELQEKRRKVEAVKQSIRNLISEKDEKGRLGGEYISTIIKTSSSPSKIENAITLYNFLFDVMAIPSEKKKKKSNESAYDFYKRVGIDYELKKIRERINGEEKKINTQISKEKVKEVVKIQAKKEAIQCTKEDQKIYEDQAFKLFCESGVLEDKYYLGKDKLDIEHLQNFFKNHLQKTKQKEHSLLIDHDTFAGTPKGVIKKTHNSIILSPDDYIQLKVNYNSFKEFFLNGKWTIKGYLFDRLIECIGYDVLKHEIKFNLDTQAQYKGTTFDLYKTEFLDDTFAGADYVVEFMFPKTKTPQIAVIDLFASDKKEDSEGYITKKAQTLDPKIPYSIYMNLLAQSNQYQYTMKPLTRYLEQQSPELIHSLLKKIMENQSFDINKFLLEEQEKRKILGFIRPGVKVDENIVRNLQKISA